MTRFTVIRIAARSWDRCSTRGAQGRRRQASSRREPPARQSPGTRCRTCRHRRETLAAAATRPPRLRRDLLPVLQPPARAPAAAPSATPLRDRRRGPSGCRFPSFADWPRTPRARTAFGARDGADDTSEHAHGANPIELLHRANAVDRLPRVDHLHHLSKRPHERRRIVRRFDEQNHS